MKIKLPLIGKIMGPLTFMFLCFIPTFSGLSFEGRMILATTCCVGIWWMTEAIPIEATALLPIIIFPITGAFDIKATTFLYSHPLIFLFLGGFMIAIAIERWNLHQRIALNIIVKLGSKPRQLILGFMIATGLLSMWISNTASTLMMVPIGLSVVSTSQGDAKFTKALLLSIAFSASIGGMATLIGTPPNIVFAAVIKESFGITINFIDWMLLGVPFSSLLIFITWLVITRVVFDISNETGSSFEITRQLGALGKISFEEKRVLIVFVTTAFLWMTRRLIWQAYLPHLNDTIIAIFGGLSLFLIPSKAGTKLLTWEMMKEIPWGVLLLFGGGLSIANAFVKTDLATWLGSQLHLFQDYHLFFLIIIIVSVVNFVTEFTSNIATASMVLPILAALSISIGIHPYYLMVGAILAASSAFMLPVATAPNAIVFSNKKIGMKDMIKTGIYLNVISIAIISLLVYYLMPLVWTLPVIVK